MKAPSIIYLTPEWVKMITETHAYFSEIGYVPARPIGFASRIKAAWLVLIGKADALVWPGDQ